MSHVSINNTLVAEKDAVIPISDRGLRFGDGVFETILVRYGKPYLWVSHMHRVEEGLEALSIDADISELEKQSMALLKKNKITDGILRIMITRGSGSRGYLPMPKEGDTPTIIIEANPLPQMKFREHIELYISSWRKPSPLSMPTEHKLMQGVNSTLAKLEARENDCMEALMLSEKGHVAECSSYNIFWMRGKTIYTPCTSTGCLAGVTRDKLLRLTPYRFKAGRYGLKALLKADAVVMTSSLALAVPVHGIKGHKVKWEQSNKLADLCNMAFEQDIENSLNDDDSKLAK